MDLNVLGGSVVLIVVVVGVVSMSAYAMWLTYKMDRQRIALKKLAMKTPESFDAWRTSERRSQIDAMWLGVGLLVGAMPACVLSALHWGRGGFSPKTIVEITAPQPAKQDAFSFLGNRPQSPITTTAAIDAPWGTVEWILLSGVGLAAIGVLCVLFGVVSLAVASRERGGIGGPKSSEKQEQNQAPDDYERFKPRS